ncbi:MAG: hypothetical protein B0D96_11095 [Candidatus Sedimenticola endophacoides]|uniref:TlpA family protein disulfide reductase n=2 Tax=Candidatus Sedimenticola endophacoides TaxID=2548426 RepID=A0A6N4DVW7_9GAMM|nr:MAG: hypothetical protein B0D94_00635 [Candidatus Sedimenticola endophacoides]OQX33735.1 MAG: hypothetical protein B0D96_11095 [Candidatus Sedimenticola endophacoides]OQX40710.1 MAG: hypothetical protein B0D89_06595 [Candidatus Sedimenticola endophacoides]PUD99834.1 MAG: TlpA family protein disulfide reductase [Candidatus Sedimenticola endophacoides]PUE02243.1 MAG: TlpA family protein disulfide reductase [Candidatus Sedimenticola endophacoides]
MRRAAAPLGALLIALLTAAVWYGMQHLGSAPEQPIHYAGDGAATLPPFQLPGLDSKTHHSDQWRGKVLVVNFWATWCPPCRDEMPLLRAWQHRHGGQGLQIVGIAIDDPAMVRDFIDVYDIRFPVLTGGPEAIALSRTMGNRFESLPFTAIYDRQGNMRHIQSGQISEATLSEQLLPLL